MNFKELMENAKGGNAHAAGQIYLMYRPLLLKESIVDGMFDEDLYQELSLILLTCIQKFRI